MPQLSPIKGAFTTSRFLSSTTGRLCALFLVSSIAIPTAFAFGNEGHETVGCIAAELIQGTAAEQHVNALLGSDTLGHAATWADRAKYGPFDAELTAFGQANPNHHTYHYTDVPIQEVQYVDGTAGTTSDDIVHIMKQCIDVLSGNDTPATNPHSFTPRTALLLLTHFVGDIHQPLHVGAAYLRQVNGKEQLVNPNIITTGYAEDHGGGWLHYTSKGLHSYWDNNGVKRAMTKAGVSTPQDYANYIVQHSPVVPQTTGPVADWPKKWADEMLPIAAQAHKGFKFGPRNMVTNPQKPTDPPHPDWPVIKTPAGYPNKVRDTVDDRITVAGYRLAQIFNTIWP